MKALIFISLMIAARASAAEAPLDANGFAAYVEGKTLSFAAGGQSYGTEEYLPGNKVRWAFDGDTCLEGLWYQSGNNICFVYEDGGAPHCWQFFLTGGRLRAEFLAPNGIELYEAQTTDEPLMCMGPQVGA